VVEERTFELVLHKRHRAVDILGAHLLHAGAEASDGQDDDVADLLVLLDAGKVHGGDVPRDALLVLEVLGVVEVAEDGVRPDGGARKLDDALVHLGLGEDAGLLHAQRVLGDGRDDIAQHGVAGLGLDGPLAELDAARVPLVPVGPVGVCLDADDEADGGPVEVRGQPVDGGLERDGVDVAVDAAAGEQDQVAEEVGLEDAERQRLVGLLDLGHRGVQVADQVEGGVVGDDLMDETRVQLRPAGLVGAQLLLERAGRRRVLPCLPDVRGELALDVVGELVPQALPQRLAGQFLGGQLRHQVLLLLLRLGLWCVGGVRVLLSCGGGG